MGIIASKDDQFKDINFDDIDLEEQDIIPDDFKMKILKEFILPYYRSNIEYVINEKTSWSRVGTGFLTTSTILIGAASILSFASSTYPEKNLNFVAGSVGMVALVLKEFASYANSVDHIKTLTLNDLLKNIGLKHTVTDSSRNFKKMMQQQKMETPTPIANDFETKFEHLFMKYMNKNNEDDNIKKTNIKEDIQNSVKEIIRNSTTEDENDESKNSETLDDV